MKEYRIQSIIYRVPSIHSDTIPVSATCNWPCFRVATKNALVTTSVASGGWAQAPLFVTITQSQKVKVTEVEPLVPSSLDAVNTRMNKRPSPALVFFFSRSYSSHSKNMLRIFFYFSLLFLFLVLIGSGRCLLWNASAQLLAHADGDGYPKESSSTCLSELQQPESGSVQQSRHLCR